MSKFPLLIFCILSFIGFGFIGADYLDWSSSKVLSFSDFKAAVPKTASKESVVNLSTLITFETRQVKGKVPSITIYNRVDRTASWIKVKKEEILKIQQIKFDYSELYARKIRKDIAAMNKKGVVEKEKYVAVISKQARLLEKRQRGANVLLEDQPYLIKIMQNDIKDSLNLYKDFAK